MTNGLHSVFGIFGDLTGLFLFLAPVITFKRIVLNKSTEQFSGIPYVMTTLNCLLSAWYGLPFVSPNNILVSVVNGTGAGIEAIYVLIFLIYAPKKEKLKILELLTFVLIVFCTVALVSLFALHHQKRKIFCGFAASIFSVIMYGSPLSVMVSNGFGCGLGILQLILYAIYCKNKGQTKNLTADESSALEMGLANGNDKSRLDQKKPLSKNDERK